MILPIYAYGHPVLKKKGKELMPGHEGLETLIADMYETMYNAKGVGLAAQQIGQNIMLFIVDTLQTDKEGEPPQGIRQVFINTELIDDQAEDCTIEEGCLSIPEIRGEVDRPEKIRIRYQDEFFVNHEQEFTGYNARVIQHELDHNNGILFVEKLGPIKKQLIRRKLDAIRKGKIVLDYKMKFMPK